MPGGHHRAGRAVAGRLGGAGERGEGRLGRRHLTQLHQRHEAPEQSAPLRLPVLGRAGQLHDLRRGREPVVGGRRIPERVQPCVQYGGNRARIATAPGQPQRLVHQRAPPRAGRGVAEQLVREPGQHASPVAVTGRPPGRRLQQPEQAGVDVEKLRPGRGVQGEVDHRIVALAETGQLERQRAGRTGEAARGQPHCLPDPVGQTAEKLGQLGLGQTGQPQFRGQPQRHAGGRHHRRRPAGQPGTDDRQELDRSRSGPVDVVDHDEPFGSRRQPPRDRVEFHRPGPGQQPIGEVVRVAEVAHHLRPHQKAGAGAGDARAGHVEPARPAESGGRVGQRGPAGARGTEDDEEAAGAGRGPVEQLPDLRELPTAPDHHHAARLRPQGQAAATGVAATAREPATPSAPFVHSGLSGAHRRLDIASKDLIGELSAVTWSVSRSTAPINGVSRSR